MNQQTSTTSSVLRVYVKSQTMTISSSDLKWGGHNCGQPMGTSQYDRTGKTGKILPKEQSIFLDAVTRAVNQTGVSFEIVDIGEWGFLKRIRKGRSVAVPCVEYNGGVLERNLSTTEIVQFISESF